MNRRKRTNQSKITLKPVRSVDRDFLISVFESSRPDIQAIPLPAKQKEIFLRSQFDAQTTHFEQYFPNASHDRILFRNQPAGRLYVDASQNPVVIVDITLLPDFRNQGIGSWIFNQIIADANRQKKTIRLSVRPDNPALSWYYRLGFQITETGPTVVGMQKLPVSMVHQR